MVQPLRILVTGAAGQIAYSLLYSIASGNVFGTDQPLDLIMLDISPMLSVLEGVTMELQDCAFPNVHKLVASDKEEVAFADIDVAFLVGAMPRKEGMERKELLKCNVNIFKSQGKALNKYAKRTVKVLVVGNPANTNAMICSHFAPDIPKENFSAMTRLDQNRGTAAIANKLNVTVSEVKNVVIWGNHSSTQYPYLGCAIVNVGPTGSAPVKVCDALSNDKEWIQGEFVKFVQQRGASVIAARKLSSAMSAAKAACDHMRDWWWGTKDDACISMAIQSDGKHYGIPGKIFFSFPVTIDSSKSWKIVDGLPMDEFSQHKLDITAKELLEEMNDALEFTN